MAHYVDLHSHFLPGLDDGSTELSMSLAMIRVVADLGFHDLFATPHQRMGMFMPTLLDIDKAFQLVSAAVSDAGLAVKLGLGAENFWDEVFHGRAGQGTIP